MAKQGLGALLININSFLASCRPQLAELAANNGIATIGSNRLFPEAGLMMSYGDRRAGSFRQAGAYVGRILKGEKPADLPVLQPTKFELVVDLKAAKAIGLKISESFLLRADEVIE